MGALGSDARGGSAGVSTGCLARAEPKDVGIDCSINYLLGSGDILPGPKGHCTNYCNGAPVYNQLWVHKALRSNPALWARLVAYVRVATRPTIIGFNLALCARLLQMGFCIALVPHGAGRAASPVGLASVASLGTNGSPTLTSRAGALDGRILLSCGRPCLIWLAPYMLQQTLVVITTHRNMCKTMCDQLCPHGAPLPWSGTELNSKNKDLATNARSCTTTNNLARIENKLCLVMWCCWHCAQTELDLVAITSIRRQTTPPQSGGNSSGTTNPPRNAGGTTKVPPRKAGGATNFVFKSVAGGCHAPGAGVRGDTTRTQ